MRRTFLVVTVKRWLKLVCIYGTYPKIKTGLPLFGPPCILQIGKHKGKDKLGAFSDSVYMRRTIVE